MKIDSEEEAIFIAEQGSGGKECVKTKPTYPIVGEL